VRLCLLACLLPFAAWAADDGAGYVRVPGGNFTTVLAYEDARGPLRIAPFAMMRQPVTNAEFLAFVKAHQAWRRDSVAPVFADAGYLTHWQGPVQLMLGAQPAQPVTRVSWFAAAAYCEARHARLPRWEEWEYVAAADVLRRDARADPAWRERILAWYARPSSSALPPAGAGASMRTDCAICTAWSGNGPRTTRRFSCPPTTATRAIPTAAASAAPGRCPSPTRSNTRC